MRTLRTCKRDEFCRICQPNNFGGTRPIIVEALPPKTAARYVKLGLDFYTPDTIDSSFVKRRIESALRQIALVPGIAAVIGELLVVVHLLKPPGPDYDVSYSDPNVPFSIFVSLWPGVQACGDPRLAEAIVHGVHLQLTLLEDVLPLVTVSSRGHYSPWKGMMRPSQGILHGLYVFRVIDDFLTALLECTSFDKPQHQYLTERRATIKNEIAAIVGFEDSQDLTPLGRRVVLSLLAPSPSAKRRTEAPT